MALSATTVSAAIAALSISGMKSIRDVTNIPESVEKASLPILFPDPTQWLQAGSGAQDEETTFGTPSGRYWQVHRSYAYVWLYSEVGDKRGMKSVYSGASTMLDAIVTALTQLDVAGVDVEGVTHSQLGVISDPSEKRFYGAFLNIACLERINA